MKKTVGLLLLLSTISFANTEKTKINNVAKEKEIEKQVKAEDPSYIVEAKGKKIIREIRHDMNEPLQAKVARAEGGITEKMKAADLAFQRGDERIAFVRNEENEIIAMQEALGIEVEDKFLSKEFDKSRANYQETKAKTEALLKENEKLRLQLAKLQEMKAKLTKIQ